MERFVAQLPEPQAEAARPDNAIADHLRALVMLSKQEDGL